MGRETTWRLGGVYIDRQGKQAKQASAMSIPCLTFILGLET